MLVPVRLNSQRILRLAIFIGLFWYIAFCFLGSNPFNYSRHAITASDIVDNSAATILGLNDASKAALLSTSVAHQFCRAHGFSPFHISSSTPRRKVYELLLINTELDWLEVRLSTLYDHVDYFVIVEAAKTFTGLPKPLLLKDNWENFAKWHSKIVYHQLDFPEHWNPLRTWDYENLQRDATYTQVIPKLEGEQRLSFGDVIIVADMDEIPRPATIALLRSCHFPKRLTLRSRFYYYSFQFLHRGPEWAHPQATYFTSEWGTLKPVDLRNGDGGIPSIRDLEKGDLWNAAWHCSSCFANTSNFLNKMESFSHTSLNKEEYRNRDRIADRVRNGKDLWDRPGQMYDKIESNEDVPKPLLEDREKWKYMMDRGGESAGFRDYP